MEQKSSLDKTPHPSLIQKTQNLLPMAVQGLRSNPRDSDSHVVYFNAEALIGWFAVQQLLTEIDANCWGWLMMLDEISSYHLL